MRHGPTPNWVKQYEFDEALAEKTSSSENIDYLLVETQYHWPKKTRFTRMISKPRTQIGLDQLATLQIEFDPDFQKVILHKLQIYREGEWKDRLNSSRCELLHPENDLDQGIFRGNYNLVYFLQDIRQGDLIEYAFTISGEHPLFTSHLSKSALFQYGVPVEKRIYRLVSDRNHKFAIRNENTDLKPQIQTISNNLCEWIWEQDHISSPILEENQPSWYAPYSVIQISGYDSWKTLAQQFLPLFEIPSHSAKNLLQIQELVKKWKTQTKEPSKLALLALRFVQDEIRYFGFEDGINSHKPSAPWEIFERRYGDCKDKTLLLHQLLKMLNIASAPLLVHSTKGKSLNQSLPSPDCFDHAVLQVFLSGKTLFVDPTCTLQGGTLEKNYFPNYGWGLSLQKNSPDLIKLPKSSLEDPIDIRSKIVLISNEQARLTSQQTFLGQEADTARRYFHWMGLEKYTKNYLNDLQKNYGNAQISQTAVIEDDRVSNKLVMTKAFLLPIEETSDGHRLKVYSSTANDYFINGVNPIRNSPLALDFPLWVKEHIEVKLSHPATQEKKAYSFDHDSFQYNHEIEVQGKQADFHYELKHIKDHIAPEQMKKYWDYSDKIAGHRIWEFTVGDHKHTPSSERPSNVESLFNILYFIIAISIFLWFKRRRRKAEDAFRL